LIPSVRRVCWKNRVIIIVARDAVSFPLNNVRLRLLTLIRLKMMVERDEAITLPINNDGQPMRIILVLKIQITELIVPAQLLPIFLLLVNNDIHQYNEPQYHIFIIILLLFKQKNTFLIIIQGRINIIYHSFYVLYSSFSGTNAVLLHHILYNYTYLVRIQIPGRMALTHTLPFSMGNTLCIQFRLAQHVKTPEVIKVGKEKRLGYKKKVGCSVQIRKMLKFV